MITKLREGVAAIVKARGFPFPVLYAPERTARICHADVVTFQRGRGGESFGAPAASGSPKGADGKRLLSWFIPGVVHVYGRCPHPSAGIGEHEDWTDNYVEVTIGAMVDWCRDNKYRLEITGAGYIPEADRSDEEQAPGVVYRVELRIGRGLFRTGYDYTVPATGVIKAVDNIVGPPPDAS